MNVLDHLYIIYFPWLTFIAIMPRFPTLASTGTSLWITHRVLELWAVAWWWAVEAIKPQWTICNENLYNNFASNQTNHWITSISDLKMKPSSQWSPVFPTTRLQSHFPVTWSQVALFWHVHLCLHSSPYFPCSQAAI